MNKRIYSFKVHYLSKQTLACASPKTSKLDPYRNKELSNKLLIESYYLNY